MKKKKIIPSKKPHHKTPKELKAQPDLEIKFGITSIQGHRQTQEDAHRAIKASDKKNSGSTLKRIFKFVNLYFLF